MADALGWVMNLNPGASMVEIQRRQGVEKVFAEPVSHDIVAELRSELVILSSSSIIDSWDSLFLELLKKMDASFCPRIIPLSNRRALLEVKSVVDRDCLLELMSISVDGVSISFSRWSPGCDTLRGSWFKPSTRWVTYVGIPCHLRTFEVMNSLCGKFVKVKEIAELGQSLDSLSGVSVLVSNCDVKLIPQFLPLVDLGGVV